MASLFSEPSGESLHASELERYQAYKAISPLAVVSMGLGILSVLTFFEWAFAIVPLVGVALGLVALRQIRTRSHELAGLPLAWGGVILSAVLLPAGWGWLYYVYRTEVPEGYQRIHYDLLRPTPEEPDRFPTRAAEALDGQEVFLKGYMLPPGRSEVPAFVLCRDNNECCFGGQPKPWDMVQVQMRQGERAKVTTWQYKVAGKLRVIKQPKHIQEAGGNHLVYYFIEEAFLR